ncbi:YkgJ family cysteine cluster protein [Prosthecobacter sp.]|uniref:YkgJ family cysteine cluster protein n=1 Tax=Prosthecobacter sp. TaxID=1965333 RepID=UPI00378474F7
MAFMTQPDSASPCQTCGACCAHYRVSFYWQEAGQRGLDESMLVQVSPWQVCFKGTEQKPVRCVNLEGEIGSCVSCRIYEQRTTPCRSVEIGDEKCLQARKAHGLGGAGMKGLG